MSSDTERTVAADSPDLRIAVDAFLAESKTLEGSLIWQPAGDRGDFAAGCSVLWRDENVGELQLKAYPQRSQQPSFRINLLMHRVIWRLDYVTHDPPHVNSNNRPVDLEAGPITGPHFHSWADNRRFARLNALPSRLLNARVLNEPIRTFEQALWWFCEQTNIEITTQEVPEYPRRQTLL